MHMTELSIETMHAIKDIDRRLKDRHFSRGNARQSRLDTLSRLLCEKRDDAVTARLKNNTEVVWRESEERYAGIDEMNRDAMTGRTWYKSTDINGPLYGDFSRPRTGESRSTVYPRLTARYVDSVHAKLCEMVLSPDDKSFSLNPTPVPDLVTLAQDESLLQEGGVTLMKDTPLAQDEKPPAPSPDGGALPPEGMKRTPLTVKDVIEEDLKKAKDGAKKAERRILDWMVQGHYNRETRRMIFDCIRLGTGVLKGPYPQSVKRKAVKKEPLGDGKFRITIEMNESVRPTLSRVNPWNFFPDESCGDDPANGDYVLERFFMSAKQVRHLASQPGYMEHAIRRVIIEGPEPSHEEFSESHYSGSANSGKQFIAWYFYGSLTLRELRHALPDFAQKYSLETDERDALHEVNIIATIINNTIVRVVLNPLESGGFPYHVIPYIYKEGEWFGESLPERLEVPERILVGATRAMMNNAGISSGSQFIIQTTGLIPANGSYVITPDKIWTVTDEAVTEDV